MNRPKIGNNNKIIDLSEAEKTLSDILEFGPAEIFCPISKHACSRKCPAVKLPYLVTFSTHYIVYDWECSAPILVGWDHR